MNTKVTVTNRQKKIETKKRMIKQDPGQGLG